MSAATTVRNALLAVLISLATTGLFAVLFVLLPLIPALLSGVSSSSGTGGIGAVSGGVSASFGRILPLLAVVLFLIIFGLLQRKRVR